jgi:hypothetical protein
VHRVRPLSPLILRARFLQSVPEAHTARVFSTVRGSALCQSLSLLLSLSTLSQSVALSLSLCQSLSKGALGGRRRRKFYKAEAFLGLQAYQQLQRWSAAVEARPATQRGLRVNGFGEDAVVNRHSAADFDKPSAETK